MIAAIVLGVVVVFSLYFLLRSKGQTFSSVEKAVIAKLAEEEANALSDFQIGKEAVIAEYERLKLRAESLVSLKAKLPAPVVASVPQAVQPPVVAAPVAVPAPVVVAPAPVIEVAANPTPVVDPNASITL